MVEQLASVVAVSVIFGTLGSIAVWNSNAFLGHVLSHSMLFPPALCIVMGVYEESYILVVNILFSIGFGAMCIAINRLMSLNQDTVLLFISLIFPSLAIIISTFSRQKIDLMSYVIGDVMLVNRTQMWCLIILAFFVLIFVSLNWKKIVFFAFNKDIATVVFGSSIYLEVFTIVLQSISIATSINMVGALLMSGSYTVPATLSIKIAKSPLSMVILSISLALFANFTGIFASYVFNIPATPTIILCYAMVSILFLLSTFRKKG